MLASLQRDNQGDLPLNEAGFVSEMETFGSEGHGTDLSHECRLLSDTGHLRCKALLVCH